MKTPEELLEPFVERPFRHTEVVEKDNAILAMKKYANQFRGMNWISTKEQPPKDYETVILFDSRDNNMSIGYCVWSQTPVDYITHYMQLPATP